MLLSHRRISVARLELLAGLSQTHQSSATHIGFGSTSAIDGSPILLPTKKGYQSHAGQDATLLDQSHTDLGAGVLLDPPYQVGCLTEANDFFTSL